MNSSSFASSRSKAAAAPALDPAAHEARKAVLEQCFKRFDIEHAGFIERTVLVTLAKAVFGAPDEKAAEETADTILREMDTDHDNRISMVDFVDSLDRTDLSQMDEERFAMGVEQIMNLQLDSLCASSSAFVSSDLAGLKLLHRGKVRDVYEVDADSLLFVATDRISAFDVVMKNGIAGKGKILTQMSAFWFRMLGDRECGRHHLISADVDAMPASVRRHSDVLRGRVMLVSRLKMFPVESVVRGYITGSGFKEYKEKGSVCGIVLPPGLVDCQKLEQLIFTPATKAAVGDHDENISYEKARTLVGDAIDIIRARSVELYNLASAFALSKGIIIADTKFEFGINATGQIVLADEIFTPDCSRFWSAAQYTPGRQQDSLDKQFVRNYLESIAYDKKTPIDLPSSVCEQTIAKYVEIFRILTGGDPRL